MEKENVVYIYNGLLFRLTKGKSAFVTWINLEDIKLSEISQTHDLSYMWTLKKTLKQQEWWLPPETRGWEKGERLIQGYRFPVIR